MRRTAWARRTHRSGSTPAQSTGSQQETTCRELRRGRVGSKYLSLGDDNGPHLVYHVLPAGFQQHSSINHAHCLSCGEALVTASSTLSRATCQQSSVALVHLGPRKTPPNVPHSGRYRHPTHSPLATAKSISSRASFAITGHTISVRIFSCFWGRGQRVGRG